MNTINKINKSLGEIKEELYMAFWDERSSDSVLLDAMVQYVEDSARLLPHARGWEFHNGFFWREATRLLGRVGGAEFTSQVAIAGYGRRLSPERARFIVSHEEAGSSFSAAMELLAVARRASDAIYELSRAFDNTLAVSRKPQKDNVSGPVVPPWAWLKECKTARDVVLTLWVNYFADFIWTSAPDDDDIVFRNLINPGFAPPMPRYLSHGVVLASKEHTLSDIIGKAKAHLPSRDVESEYLSLASYNGGDTPLLQQKRKNIIADAKNVATGFLEDFAPEIFKQKLGYQP